MKISGVEATGFRGFVSERFTLDDLTVFHGEMGCGKTSRLLAVLYCLTGATPPGLHLDDLINTNSEFMYVRALGSREERPFMVERRKARGQASKVKLEGVEALDLDYKMFIEGREIAQLFAGAPTEKALKLDALLGLSHYDEIASAVTAAPIERRIGELERLRSTLQQSQSAVGALAKTDEEIDGIQRRLEDLGVEEEQGTASYTWAEDVLRRADEARRTMAEMESKRGLITSYRAQLSALTPFRPELEEDARELEARHEAIQRRIAFLESAMQTLDLEGKKPEEMAACPLCGAALSPGALARFKHYSEEYGGMIARSSELETILVERRAKLEKAVKEREQASVIQSQIEKLEREVATLSSDMPLPQDAERAASLLKRRDELRQERRELRIRLQGLEEQKRTYEGMVADLRRIPAADLEGRLRRLYELRERMEKIRAALVEAVNEVRDARMAGLKADFAEAFRTIYPYKYLLDIDIEKGVARGREVLMIKGRTEAGWLYSHQMSTGENVAISFALLFAVNKLKEAPILLLDEPEEGLDENGIRGLADILNRLKASTQILVATRSQQLAQLLAPKSPS